MKVVCKIYEEHIEMTESRDLIKNRFAYEYCMLVWGWEFSVRFETFLYSVWYQSLNSRELYYTMMYNDILKY